MEQTKSSDEHLIGNFNERYINELCTLFRNTRSKKFTFQFFQKKYSTIWCKKDLLGKVLLNGENNLLGFCGTTLYQFKGCNNESYLFGQLGDLLMHPEQQGKGNFNHLLNELEKEAQNRSIDALFVFPNLKAQPLFQKRKNWEQIGSFVSYSFHTKTYPFLKVLNKLGLSNFFYFWAELFGSTRHAKINWSEVNSGTIHVQNSASYFAYKQYGQFRFHQYVPTKEIIWSLSDGLIINASQVETQEELQNEIQFLRTFCKWRGIHQFRYICYDHSKLGELLKESKLDKRIHLPVYLRTYNSSIDPKKIVFQGIDRNAF